MSFESIDALLVFPCLNKNDGSRANLLPGQTFLHAAAGRLNGRILAARRGRRWFDRCAVRTRCEGSRRRRSWGPIGESNWLEETVGKKWRQVGRTPKLLVQETRACGNQQNDKAHDLCPDVPRILESGGLMFAPIFWG